MTTLYTTPNGYGRHRQAEPHGEESVPRKAPVPPQAPAPVPVPVPVAVPVAGPATADPPIYQDVLSLWASQGRTLPGHRDQEWNRLAAGPVWADRTVRVSGTLVRRGDVR
ncbi:hypothetical protein [Streptomyces gardneri]|uniref:hypothetical protein n=1 Tax=Streptomyces gardneri TaxID=66892 RepID=UPI0006BD3A35|nr:hypothetical protein [Streptomyces gardneri]WRK35682.1 hypothetical protein U0M97_07085 [Streptomyces venezuelae]CUM42673.1 hypothetical protein BN2537_14311 [Streptomyces venezuelae]